MYKGLSLLSKCSCTQIQTCPCLQGILQRVIRNMTVLAWLWLETSEAEIKAVHEGRERMGSRHGREEGRKKCSTSVEEALPAGAMVRGGCTPGPPAMLGTAAAFGFQVLLK